MVADEEVVSDDAGLPLSSIEGKEDQVEDSKVEEQVCYKRARTSSGCGERPPAAPPEVATATQAEGAGEANITDDDAGSAIKLVEMRRTMRRRSTIQAPKRLSYPKCQIKPSRKKK